LPNENIWKNGIRKNGACPVECLPNEMPAQLNAALRPSLGGFNRGEAHQGLFEVVLPDGTSCDCLTDIRAIEFDYGNNRAEAIGQKISEPFNDSTN